MGFKKGHKKVGGIKKGNVQTKTKAWDMLGMFFTEAGAERAKKIMMSSEDKDFMNYYGMLVELFKPKLARTEVSGDINLNRTISDTTHFNLHT